MPMTSFYFKVIVLFIPFMACGQVVDRYLAQPGLKLSWHNDSRWSFNTAVEQRTAVSNQLDPLHIQVAQFAHYEVGFYSQIGIGVMYRELLEKGRPEELRLTAQLVHAKKYNQFKVAHRLRWNQRLREQRVTHRFRYHLSGSIPLNGNQVDASEYYITGHIEALMIVENHRTPTYDQRIGAGIGRQLGSKTKLQLQTEYRWEAYTIATERLLLTSLALYYNL